MLGKKKGALKKEIENLSQPKESVPDSPEPKAEGDQPAPKDLIDLDRQIAAAQAQEADQDPDVKAGRRVVDPATRQPFYLPPNPLMRISLAFPEADDALRASQRLSWSSSTSPEEVKAFLLEAAKGGNSTMKAAVLANLDYMGYDTARFLTGLKMNAQYRKSEAEVAPLVEARNLYLLALACLSCPFEQLMKEAEIQIGTMVNNFPAVEALGSQLAEPEVCGCWFLLKAAVATWEDKLMFDQRALNRIKKEERPDGGADERKQEELIQNTANNLGMWQKMSGVFGSSAQAQAKLLPEMRFLDQALTMATDTDVRFFAAQTFCSPASVASGVGLAEPELRERLRRLGVLCSRLAAENYSGMTSKLRAITEALEEGSSSTTVSFYAQARTKGLTRFQTYEMPLSGVSALREFEMSGVNLKKRPRRKAEAKKPEPPPKPKRPTGLDWYHTEEEMSVREVPAFMRKQLDPDADSPELWDSTIKVNKNEAEALAQCDEDGFMGLPMNMVEEFTKGLNGTPEELEEFDRKLAEDEAAFERLLEETYREGIGDKDWNTGSKVLSAFDVELTPEALGISQAEFDLEMKEAKSEIAAYADKLEAKEE